MSLGIGRGKEIEPQVVMEKNFNVGKVWSKLSSFNTACDFASLRSVTSSGDKFYICVVK